MDMLNVAVNGRRCAGDHL